MKVQSSVDLLQDQSMYEFFESGVRGGMTFTNKHHVKRNVPDEEDYDLAKPHTEMLYIDANNLYGYSMSMPLPQKNFQWVEDPSVREQLIRELPDMDIFGSFGFVADVDVEIPSELKPLIRKKQKWQKSGCQSICLNYWVRGSMFQLRSYYSPIFQRRTMSFITLFSSFL